MNYREQRKRVKEAKKHVLAALECISQMDREPSVTTLDTVLMSVSSKLDRYSADLTTRQAQSDRLKRQQRRKKVAAQ